MQRLSQDEGISLPGIARILQLENQVAALQERVAELSAELETRRRGIPDAHTRVFSVSPSGDVYAARPGSDRGTSTPGTRALVRSTRKFSPVRVVQRGPGGIQFAHERTTRRCAFLMRLEAGVVVGERYELVQSVASGGMGDVWRARDRVLGRSVAVKMMRPDVIAEPVFAERFHEEAILMAGLSHHNIATLFDYGTYEGIAYLVMEFVEGQSLSAELREAGVLPVERVRAVVAQMALALAAAHEAGVVHRDVKPANVLIGPDGIVKS